MRQIQPFLSTTKLQLFITSPEQQYEMGDTLRRHNDRQSLLVTAVCLLGAMVGCVLLYRDFNSADQEGTGKPLATLERAIDKVRRKASESYVWKKTADGARLYRHDSVQTGPDSTATIKLVDGTQIQLSENSLIVIDDLANVELGFLNGSGQGSVVIQKATGEDFRIRTDESGKAVIERLPVRLLKPAPLEELIATHDGTLSVSFSWIAPEESESKGLEKRGQRLLVAKNSQFKPSVFNANISTSQQNGLYVKTIRALSVGEYYWKVVEEFADGKTVESTLGRFQISSWNLGTRNPNEPEEPAAPTPEVVSPQVQKSSDGKVVLEWTKIPRADAYEVAVTDPQDRVAAKTKTALTTWTVELPFGTFFTKIRAVFGLDSSEWSKPQAIMNFPKSLGVRFVRAPDGQTNRAIMSWNALRGVHTYQVEVRRGPTVLLNKPVKGTRVEVDISLSGKYVWKVRPLVNGSALQEGTETGELEVRPEADTSTGFEDEIEALRPRRYRGLLRHIGKPSENQ